MAKQELLEAMRPPVVAGICSAEETSVFIHEGVQMAFIYRGVDGGVIGEIVVKPSDCK
jgi:hypothetical protein